MKKGTKEYLRRNELHAASVGALAGVHSIVRRLLKRRTRSPTWLFGTLIDIGERLERVAPEMAAHRDEVKVTRKKR